jgi:hypothetical protein
MTFPNCNTMREGVLVSAVLLLLGVVLILAASRLLPDIDALLLTTNTLGIVSLLLAPLVLLATVILTLAWPGARQQMRDCNH